MDPDPGSEPPVSRARAPPARARCARGDPHHRVGAAMSYAQDAKTLALYDLDAGGTNLTGDSNWDLADNGDGTFSAPANIFHLYRFGVSNNWTVEREVTIADAPGT